MIYSVANFINEACMHLSIPELALVVLIGPSGAGKSTFASTHFRSTEVLSSDRCRGLVADDENDQSASSDAFDVLHYIARKRLAAGRLTVIDATNVQSDARKPLVALAREFHVLPVAIVFNLPERVCHSRNEARPDRTFGPHVIRRQAGDMRRSLRGLAREGFRHVFTFESEAQVQQATVTRQPLWTNRRDDHGPFDLIGDVHGCIDELRALLVTLGYAAGADGIWAHPEGRRALFLGDLVDRGPDSPAVLRLVMDMVRAGNALCIPGNHDDRLLRKLRGRDIQLTHGLAETVAQLDATTPAFREEVTAFLDSLVSHYVMHDSKLVVAHAGLKESLQGRASGTVRSFALYGDTTGETDELGLPVRQNWAADYRGRAMVVYGHTPVDTPEWVNNTINIDTGCVFGGKLTALRYPERELVQVPAQAQYAIPARPFLDSEPLRTAQHELDDTLDLADVQGRQQIGTRLGRTVTIREGQAAAALEVMSRFAIDPKWLIYLPPTMAPTETSTRPDALEHPAEAFAAYRSQGIATVICEEKHMGSRAVVVLCRDEAAAARRFGIQDGRAGVIYTRTGRPFFDDRAWETALLEQVRQSFSRAGLWEELATDWALLDCELLPWSAKAQALLRQQYAAVGAAGRLALGDALGALRQAAERITGIEQQAALASLTQHISGREQALHRYTDAYRRYCWPVSGPGDLRLAPFHLLASEGHVYIDKSHRWHMDTLARLAASDDPAAPLLIATATREVDLLDADSIASATDWWETLTAQGGEGMVVKPRAFVAHGPHGLVQPAIKCRGREYLRIIYGPEYALPAHLERLRARNVGAKRALALREFALGIEGLERFIRREPLRRVHACVSGVLALESEPVDPRL